MASLQERRDKNGKLISYSIRVHRGRDAEGKQLKPYTATFEVSPTWTEASARKKAEAFAAVFEKQCREGTARDTRQTFAQYSEYVINLKEERGTKATTVARYREMLERINAEMGNVRLKDIRPDVLNKFYSALAQSGANKRTGEALSNKTIVEHHRLIHMILKQAVIEDLIPLNPADKVIPPKAERPDVRYYQPEEIEEIEKALEEEPIKWKALVHVMLITGARRGEILGLKWEDIDFKKCTININKNIQYTPSRGVFVDSPKTKAGYRTISVPPETMKILRDLKAWQAQEKLRIGIFYEDKGFLFAKDNGDPMHPDSPNRWLQRFAKRHGLPPLNPHAFRHSMASVLFRNNSDSVSIAHRLGHAQVSTTANIYAHIIEQADEDNAEILRGLLLKKDS